MINGMRIRQAREWNRLTQVELARDLGVAQTTVAHIEGGIFQPSPDVLDALSNRLGVPGVFFERDDPPQFPEGSLRFRGQTDLSLVDKREAQRYAEIEFEAFGIMIKQVRSKIRLSIPQLGDEPTSPAEAARMTRALLGVSPDSPISHLLRLLEESGVLVFALPLRLEGREAYSLWTGSSGLWSTGSVRWPVIVLSGGVSVDRMRLSAAHELGHLVMHHAVRGTTKELEKEAYAFAAEFLMPEDVIRDQLVPPLTLTSLAALKARWRVSMQALMKRAYELKIISKRQYNYLFEQLRSKGWKTEEPVELAPEKPRALARMAEVVYGANTAAIDFQRFADAMGQYPHTMKRILAPYASREEYTSRSSPRSDPSAPLELGRFR